MSTINFILTIYVQYLLNLAFTTTVGSNYKEMYDCKWDPMTLMNSALYTPAFKFL